MFHWVPFDVYTINTGLGASPLLFPSTKVTRKPVGSLMFKRWAWSSVLSVLLAGVPHSSWGRGGSSFWGRSRALRRRTSMFFYNHTSGFSGSQMEFLILPHFPPLNFIPDQKPSAEFWLYTNSKILRKPADPQGQAKLTRPPWACVSKAQTIRNLRPTGAHNPMKEQKAGWGTHPFSVS